MSIESEKFIKDLFNNLDCNSRYRFIDYPHSNFEFPCVNDMADFLKDMDNVLYDRKNAIIHMITKNGQIYSIDEINEFNYRNENDLKIIGVGNEVGSLTHDPGCAKFKFQINVDTYEKEVKKLGYPDFKEEIIDIKLEDLFTKLKSKKGV